MRSLNRATIIGHVGKDAEINFTSSANKMATFRVATSESWKDKDGVLQERTDWHNVVAWRGLADVCERLVRKGVRVYVEGRLHTRTFEDKDGQKRYHTEIVAENILLLDSRRHEHENGDAEAHPAEDKDKTSGEAPF